MMDRPAGAYIGPVAKYPIREVPAGVVTRVTVEKIYGVVPWQEDSAD